MSRSSELTTEKHPSTDQTPNHDAAAVVQHRVGVAVVILHTPKTMDWVPHTVHLEGRDFSLSIVCALAGSKSKLKLVGGTPLTQGRTEPKRRLANWIQPQR
jgi:hypothetical protein